MTKVIRFLTIVLAVHLWYSNTVLLLETASEAGVIENIILGVVSLSYSVIGAVSVFKEKRLWPIAVFAMLDATAVFLRICPPQNIQLVVGLFYFVYTAYIILICWSMNNQPQETNETNDQPQQPQALPAEFKTESCKETDNLQPQTAIAIDNECSEETVCIGGVTMTWKQIVKRINGMGHITAQNFYDEIPDGPIKERTYEQYSLRKGLH